jgi:Beta-lactamase
VSKQRELNFPPGTDWLYGNTNYELLGQVVSRVTGQSLREFTFKRIFEPLDMMHTWFRESRGEVITDMASPYEEGQDDSIGNSLGEPNFFLSVPNYDTVGATNLVTTVGDLAKWDQNLYTGKVGGATLVRQLLEPGELNDGTPLIYGNGWFVNTLGGLKVETTSSAGDAGYIGDMTRFPDRHLSVFVLCNLAGIDLEDLADKVGDVYLDGKVSAANAAGKGLAATAQISPKQAAKYVGTYIAAGGNYVLRIERRPDGMWAHWFWGPNPINSQIEALGENRFRFQGVEEVVLEADGNLRVKDRHTILRSQNVPYTRVPDYKPTPDELRAFAGTYVSKEIDVPFVVTFDGSRVIVHPPKNPPRPVRPLAIDLFAGQGMRLRFTRDSRGAVSGFLLNGAWNRVENLPFQRIAQPYGRFQVNRDWGRYSWEPSIPLGWVSQLSRCWRASSLAQHHEPMRPNDRTPRRSLLQSGLPRSRTTSRLRSSLQESPQRNGVSRSN